MDHLESAAKLKLERIEMLEDAVNGLALQFTAQTLDEILGSGYSDAQGEQRLIETLVRVSKRFLSHDGQHPQTGVKLDLYSRGLSAGECAIIALDRCGLAKMVHGCLLAVWTEDGLRLLQNSN